MFRTIAAVCAVALTVAVFVASLEGAPPKSSALPGLDGVESIDLPGHEGAVGCATVSRDGKLVATAGYDRKVRTFDLASGKNLDTFDFGGDAPNGPDKFGIRDRGSQNAVAFDAESKKLVACGGDWLSPDSLATAFDLKTKKPLFTSKDHKGMVRRAAFSPDGKTLVTAGHDSTLKVFDAATGKERGTFTGHDWVVTAVAFAPDGKSVASVCCNSIGRSIKIWNPDTIAETLDIPLPAKIYSIGDLAFSPDGKRLAGVSAWRLLVWDAESGKLLTSEDLDSGLFKWLAWSPDDQRIAVGGGQGGDKGKAVVRVYDTAAKRMYLALLDAGVKDLLTIAWPTPTAIVAVGHREEAAKAFTIRLKK